MNIKKISAAVMAAAVLAVGAPVMGAANPFGVVASAAEAKLVTASELEEFKGDSYVYNMYNNYFAITGGYQPGYKLIHLDIEKWRSTGSLEYSTVESEIDLSTYTYVSGTPIDGTLLLRGNEGASCYMKLDESGKLVVTEKSEYNLSVDRNYESNTATYTVTDPNGNKTEGSLSYTSSGEYDYFAVESCAFTDGKYVGCIAWKVPGSTTAEGTSKYEIYGINKDGSRDLLDTVEKDGMSAEMLGVISGYSSEFASWYGTEYINILTNNDGKLHKIKISDLNLTDMNYFVVESVYDSCAVIRALGNIFRISDRNYLLVDINTGKALSKTDKTYYSMTGDGKTFVVINYNYIVGAPPQEGEGEGYVSSSGEELGWYDHAGGFIKNGLYAPVVKDGKGWLVDRNGNQVSEKIDATSCTSIGEEIFLFSTEDKNIMVTSSGSGAGSVTEKPGNSGSTTALTDKNNGITVNGDFPAGTSLKASIQKKDDNTYVIDVSPVDANGEKVQPNGAAVVMVLVPGLNGKSVNVYRVTDGKYTKMNSWSDGDSIFFTTTHFSEFEITTKQREEANPNTGSEGTVGLAAVALIATGLLVVSRKRR